MGQVTSARGFALPETIEGTIEETLANDGISFKNSEKVGNRLLYRFNSNEDQLAGSAALRQALGEQYVVALNNAHATPTWLRTLGGKPMTLGLDLKGGVHFLMQVDMDTARSQQLDRYVDDLRAALRDERIRYVSVRREGDGVLALLRSAEDREQALDIMRRDQSLRQHLAAKNTLGLRGAIADKQVLIDTLHFQVGEQFFQVGWHGYIL